MQQQQQQHQVLTCWIKTSMGLRSTMWSQRAAHNDCGLVGGKTQGARHEAFITACAFCLCSQCRSHLTPQEVKGAAWGAIAACVSGPEAAAAAWERLTQETVLAAPGTQQALTVAIPSYDMTYQLNEIEVRSSLLPGKPTASLANLSKCCNLAGDCLVQRPKHRQSCLVAKLAGRGVPVN
jgi:hypothetical protein